MFFNVFNKKFFCTSVPLQVKSYRADAHFVQTLTQNLITRTKTQQTYLNRISFVLKLFQPFSGCNSDRSIAEFDFGIFHVLRHWLHGIQQIINATVAFYVKKSLDYFENLPSTQKT